MSGIQSWSTSANENTELWFEGQFPSTVNNNSRTQQKYIREWYNEPGWIEYGKGSGAGNGVSDNYTATYVGASEFTIDGFDVRGAYNVGRRVRVSVDGADPIYGRISGNSFSTDTSVTVDWDDTTLTAGVLRVWLGADSGDAETTGISGAALDGQETSPLLVGPTEKPQTPAVSSNTVTFTVAEGGVVVVTLTDNVTAVNVVWGSGARSFTLHLIQDGTGGRTWAWPDSWQWSGGFVPTVTSAAGARDIYVVHSYDGGATVFAGTAGQDFV